MNSTVTIRLAVPKDAVNILKIYAFEWYRRRGRLSTGMLYLLFKQEEKTGKIEFPDV